jgi:rod shape-determining protein MreC
MIEHFPSERTPINLRWRGEPPKVQAFFARHRSLFVLVAVLVGQLLLLSFQITGSRNVRLARVWAVALFDPIERSMHKVVSSVALAWRFFESFRGTQQENQQLRLELIELRSQAQRLSEQAAEAQHLRALLDFKSQLSLNSLTAEVIATSPGEASSAVFIDKGSSSGLTSDLAVVTPAGVVGKIIAVFPFSAQVLLITDPSSGVGSMLERSRVQGVLKGIDQNSCQLHYVMNDEQVSVGEMVLTSGMDRIYPKGLPVGTVVRVQNGPIYKTIMVRPAASLDRLESVLVILKPPPHDPRDSKSSPQR